MEMASNNPHRTQFPVTEKSISLDIKRDPNKPKGKRSVNQDEPVIYIKAEDEVFHELSTWSFTFPVHAEQLVPDNLKNYRQMGQVLVVKADDVPKFRENKHNFQGEVSFSIGWQGQELKFVCVISLDKVSIL
ncbi:Protein BCCIP [Ananas comosus]|uniref:Protein BCCIP n=1 Tax=Ananas comosus TaxID=4615 RepID=A0A199VTH3_ANACO|nr:Protein BCCIP [Ananas comosus]